MAKTNIKFQCGCGYTTNNYLEAAIHADSTSHTLTVLGTVHPDKQSMSYIKPLLKGK